MKTAIAIWGTTIAGIIAGLIIGLNVHALSGFILCVVCGAIPFVYEHIERTFK